MALISCFECGREVSDLAVQCPHCGAPGAAARAQVESPPATATEPVEKTCKKCGNAATIEAYSPTSSCPKCGAIYSRVDAAARATAAAPVPDKRAAANRTVNIALAVLIPIALLVLALRPNEEPKREDPVELSAAACRRDTTCWIRRHEQDARVMCQFAVERSAEYQFEWTDGILEPRFDDVHIADPAAGTLMTSGHKVKFQNAFGAWKDMSYVCIYNPQTGVARVSSIT